ncbi:serpin family protein [Zavarzinia sp. CC-PAN008]|uniref:serpin family protein n=1 Tax=Zavarzinia sp. CC-PAN008 TaxID=3243332 RepID=UPI003F7457C0
MLRLRVFVLLLLVPLLVAGGRTAAQAAATDKRVVDGMDRLGTAVLVALQKNSANQTVVISPLGLATVLTMLGQGAEGDTALRFRKVLGLGEDTLQDAGEAHRQLAESLAQNKGGVTLNTASAIWVDSEMVLNPGFVESVNASFGAPPQQVDFAALKTIGDINSWAAKETQNAIPKVLDQLDPGMRMLLANALYFKGQWTIPFDPAQTQEAAFRPGVGEPYPVQMMSRSGTFRYRSDDALQVVSLPYDRGRFEILLGLPVGGTDLTEALKQKSLVAVLQGDGLHTAPGTLRLPRFKARVDQELRPILAALGLPLTGQDYTGITEGGLALDAVRQVVALDVNEEGTEAAAVTLGESRAVNINRPFELTFDRPFYLALRDSETGTTLFAAYIADVRK